MVTITKRRTKKPEYSAEAADRAVKFFHNLKHSSGAWAGERFDLMPWQENEIIRPLFGTLNPDGNRQYRTCYVEIPRKNGKTEMAAGVGLYLLFADGEAGAQIYSCAGDHAQAGLVYQAAAPMVRQSPPLLRRAKIVDSQKRIVNYKTNSFYQVLSAEAYTKHGLSVHGDLFDELHTQPNRELWDVMNTSTGARRQPITFVMTTAGVYDVNSIAWEIHAYACKVKENPEMDPTFLPVIYSADEKEDWTSEDVWRKCNPALGVFRSLEEISTLCKRAQETPALEMTFRRLYLNQWVNSVERWMPMDKWDACNEPLDMDKLRGRPCYAGLDLSSTIDLTALALIFPRGVNAGYDILPFFWIPGDTAIEKERRDRVPYSLWATQGFINLTPGNVIDYGYIREELKKLRETYDIREIAFDRWGASKLSQDLTDDGFVMVPFGQGYASMGGPTKDLMTFVLNKQIRHGGHPVLRWNADNLVVSMDAAGNLKPDKAKATQKIDGVVACIMGLDRAIRHAADPSTSIYETEGLKVL